MAMTMSNQLTVNIQTNVYAVGEHGHEHLPWPLPADTWLWQSGDRWVAHVGMHYADSWWEGADEADIAARPMYWWRHILDVPESGVLVWNDKDGNEQTMQARARDKYGTIHPEWEAREDEGKPRFKVFIYEHREDEEDGWKFKLFLHDTKYSDSDGYPIDAVAGGNSWAEAFTRAGEMIAEAINTDHCIF
jgi:hypothetical protein